MLTLKQFDNVSVLSKNSANGIGRKVYSPSFTLFSISFKAELEIVSHDVIVSSFVFLFQTRSEKEKYF